MNCQQQITSFEGREHKAYQDTLGVWTIGIGHTGPEVHAGLVWTDEQIDAAFEADRREAESQCRAHFPWFDKLNEPRQAALISMCFQMGINRLLGFPKALAAMRDERWPQAAGEMLDSRWKQQTPKRAARLARQIDLGEWQ